ncbi:MAG: sulfide/dihydroorotate dehydrogenase-like FAD/NAD-binding protein [Ruminococcaceae bacterium]|nr:sulfide/dihydroorotate dehydrogenase-like FAD/NAD-binding protein [Oscillospiraceae bacterium]
MFELLKKEKLGESIVRIVIDAPHIARKIGPGQFVIVRSDEISERIPLTVSDFDREEGTITLICQTVGASTKRLAMIEEGEYIKDVVGPLGKVTELEGIKNVAVIGGGLGCAIAYPQAKYLYNIGANVDIIAGFRSRDFIILEDDMKAVSSTLTVLTDDGSNGNKGLVTDGLRKKIEEGANYDAVIAIGPPVMMKFVSLLTKEYGIKTIVSMNPIMIDGTGMCGGCRLTVGGEIKFACIDGPDFDGHLVDFDELIRRNGMYRPEEALANEKIHTCNLDKVGGTN